MDFIVRIIVCKFRKFKIFFIFSIFVFELLRYVYKLWALLSSRQGFPTLFSLG